MKNYFFVGVQGPNLASALAGLDELLRNEHAGKDFDIQQIIVCHEMLPGKITTGQPQVVCNCIAVLVSQQPIPVEEIKQPELPFIIGGQA